MPGGRMKLFFSIVASALCCLLFAGSKNGSVHLFHSNFQDKSFLTISYTNPSQVNPLKKDLKEFWNQFLFYSLLQERLQQSLSAEGIQCTSYQQSASTISMSCPPCQMMKALMTVCQQIEQIKQQGFSEKEFKEAKEVAYLNLHKLEEHHSKEIAQLISNDLSNEGANRNALIESSKDLIEMANLNEVSEYSRTQMIDANREIDVVVPSEESFISEHELCQILEEQKWAPEQQNGIAATPTIMKGIKEGAQVLLEEAKTDELQPQFEEIAQEPVAREQLEPLEQQQPVVEAPAIQNTIDYYAQLPITQEERKMIAKLVITLAENNVFKLLFEKKKLEKIGKRINHIHPMRFLGTILGDARLAHCLKEIRKSSFKWEGFMGGLVRRMNEELGQDNIKKYIPGFSNYFQANPDQLTRYIDQRDFEGMVISLM